MRQYWEYIHDGALGKIKEVHAWSDRAGTPERAWWPQGIERAARVVAPVPGLGLDWDLWLGPAKWRPYAFPNGRGGEAAYCPFNWRGWWDFGCGAIGDMAVHNADPAFFALDLGCPDGGRGRDQFRSTDETLPGMEHHHAIEFPAKGRPADALKLTWYDGSEAAAETQGFGRRSSIIGSNGILFVGEKWLSAGRQSRGYASHHPRCQEERVRSPAENPAADRRAIT